MIQTNRVKSVFFAALLIANPAIGQELDGTLKKIKTTGTFTLGYREAAPPFSFPGPDRRPVGYSIDLCTQIASDVQKHLGTNLKLNWGPHGPTTNRVWFWTVAVNIPADYALGEGTARIVFKTDDGEFGTYDYRFTIVPALRSLSKPKAPRPSTVGKA